MTTQWQHGWRFLNAAGGTNPSTSMEHYSVLPRPDQKWSDWTEHTSPATPDGKDCGPGRLHVMCKFHATYAPINWWPWYARWTADDVIGQSAEKVGVRRYQLRRVRPVVFWRMIRLGWLVGANLHGAGLYGADLRSADLRRVDLSGADLRGADLRDADLRGADLSGADLRSADLRRVDLSGTDLRSADLRRANLHDADLSDADLRGADLRNANLRGADVDGANLDGAVLYYAIGTALNSR